MPSLPDLPLEIILAIPINRKTLVRLAQVNCRFYALLNPEIYRHNVTRASPTRACILWGARKGRLGTVKLGHQYGGNLNLDINDADWPATGTVPAWNGDRWHYVTECGTALHLATRYGHLDVVEYLLDHGADMHAPSLACCHCRSVSRLSYPLHEVVCDVPRALCWRRDHDQDTAAATMLIRHGAYLHAPNTPVLPVLIERDRLDLIIPLLEHTGINAAAEKLMPTRPLHLAAKLGRIDIAKVLLDRPDVDITARDAFGHTAAACAAKGGHVDTLRLLLDAERVRSSSVAMDTCARAVRAAAGCGKLDAVKVLLEEYGANVTEPDEQGNTALTAAADGGHVDMVNFLVAETGIDVGAFNHQGEAAIHRAARNPPEDSAAAIIRSLVDAGADVNTSVPSIHPFGTPLRYAVQAGRTAVALTLLSCGADLSLERGPDPGTGLSLLHLCLKPRIPHLSKAELRLVRELIDRGADIESASVSVGRRTDGPPLFFAAAHAESDACVRWLLEAGAGTHLSLQNLLAPAGSDPQTLLMAVLYYRLPTAQGRISTRINLSDVRPVQECIKLLLKHGARVDSVGSEQSALQYACEVAMDGSFELLCILLRGSTRRNVSIEHLEALKAEYAPQDWDSAPPGDRGRVTRVQRRGRVFRQLSDFSVRAFRSRTLGRKK